MVDKKMISKRHWLLTIGFPSNPNIQYEPGDHIKIFPKNEPQLVDNVMEKLIEKPADHEIVVWRGERMKFLSG